MEDGMSSDRSLALDMGQETVRQAPREKEYNQELRKRRRLFYFTKRSMDIVLSFCGLIVLLPIYLFIALMIRVDSKGPAFYKSRRIGRYGKPMYILKFRTMVSNAEELIARFTPEQRKEWEENAKLENDPRITRIGRLLRRTSLDELPQLVNIFLGSLSLVGPRPLLPDEIDHYGEHTERLLSAKPGLTGYWQVNGRNAVSYEERIRLQMYYVDHQSLALDFRILIKTVGVVVKKVGAI